MDAGFCLAALAHHAIIAPSGHSCLPMVISMANFAATLICIKACSSLPLILNYMARSSLCYAWLLPNVLDHAKQSQGQENIKEIVPKLPDMVSPCDGDSSEVFMYTKMCQEKDENRSGFL
ncbi:hypothetical protein G6O67_007071 [Ophiocordyceps sinensis]|uniref:Uncharacterized protein n=1 Tax=Ophiocordyceps sinensis TaxID=72228 RepID=A0A8H4PI53_9HYPO|nr:hypothetical protein G6O67_007071 [Ophiocordyceps sinensis]